ncbi:hypothetical protein [Nocardia gipuzkoensis]
MVNTEQCWCGRPAHDDLLDGCVGDKFLRAMFGPPDLNTMLVTMMSMYGDLVGMAYEGHEEAIAMIRDNPIPGPSIEMDQAMLRLAGMDVSDEDIRSLRRHYNPTGLKL